MLERPKAYLWGIADYSVLQNTQVEGYAGQHFQAITAGNIELVNGGLLFTGVLSSHALFMFVNHQAFLEINKMVLICMY
jgi:hypothetical protein